MSTCLIHPASPPADRTLLQRLAELPTAAISDSLGRLPGARGLLPLAGSPRYGRLVGPALTVRTRPGDNLTVHKAVDLAEPGDVLAVDAGGHDDRAIVGELLCRYAASRGIAGIVLDGAARDIEEISALGIPVFARSISHLGPYKNGPGEIRGLASLGGLPVQQGDLVVGDGDGVVAVARARAKQVIAAAEALVEREQAVTRAIDEGSWDRAWVDQDLEIEYIDDITEGNGQ